MILRELVEESKAMRADREAMHAVLEGINKQLAAVERGVGKTTELGVRAAIANKRNQDYPLPALLNDGEPWCKGCVG